MESFLSQIILQKVPISQVIKHYNPDVSTSSSLIRCINPSHNDSTPSMKLYEKTNSCYCFGCGFSGNPISVVAKLENCSLLEAMQKLKKWFNIEEDFTQLTLKDRVNVKRLKDEFDKTWDFYMKQFIQKEYVFTKQDLSDLEEIYTISDTFKLKRFYEEKKSKFG